MSHISHEAAPSTSIQTMSSPPLTAMDSSQECSDNPRYRQKEVVDGNIVRLFESHRHRRRDDRPRTFGANRLNKSLQTGHLIVDTSNPLGAKSTSAVVQVAKALTSPAPSAQRSQWVDGRTSEGCIKYMQHERGKGFDELDEALFHLSELPTPPPTPRMERLPTPELEPLNERSFCDCCGRYSMRKADRPDESIKLGDRGSKW
jgi:hypothetical protein